jgi:hypothetical protein
VEREHLADARGRAVVGQKRIIGRMIRGVAEPGDGIHGDEHYKRIDEAGDRESGGAERDAGNQHDARTDAVDQKADRRLQHSRDDIEGGERQR